jgi:hypothetical protein
MTVIRPIFSQSLTKASGSVTVRLRNVLGVAWCLDAVSRPLDLGDLAAPESAGPGQGYRIQPEPGIRLGLLQVDIGDSRALALYVRTDILPSRAGGRSRDLPMDLADAALVRAAEREKISRIFTIDRRDFELYRPRGIGQFTILP